MLSVQPNRLDAEGAEVQPLPGHGHHHLLARRVPHAHLDIAARVLGPNGLAAVQNELSPRVRSGLAELDRCAATGIPVFAYSPLGGTVGAAWLAFWIWGTGRSRSVSSVTTWKFSAEIQARPRSAIGYELAFTR